MIGKVSQESVVVCLKVLFRNSPVETEKNHENIVHLAGDTACSRNGYPKIKVWGVIDVLSVHRARCSSLSLYIYIYLRIKLM